MVHLPPGDPGPGLYQPAPGWVRCLGPGCSREFCSRDKRTNRLCPVCTRRLAKEGTTGLRPLVLYTKGRRLRPPFHND